MEYDEVLDKLVDKVLVLDLKRRKNEISTQIPGVDRVPVSVSEWLLGSFVLILRRVP